MVARQLKTDFCPFPHTVLQQGSKQWAASFWRQEGCGWEAAVLPVALQMSAKTLLCPGGELCPGWVWLLQELCQADWTALQWEGHLWPAQGHVLRLLSWPAKIRGWSMRMWVLLFFFFEYVQIWLLFTFNLNLLDPIFLHYPDCDWSLMRAVTLCKVKHFNWRHSTYMKATQVLLYPCCLLSHCYANFCLNDFKVFDTQLFLFYCSQSQRLPTHTLIAEHYILAAKRIYPQCQWINYVTCCNSLNILHLKCINIFFSWLILYSKTTDFSFGLCEMSFFYPASLLQCASILPFT